VANNTWWTGIGYPASDTDQWGNEALMDCIRRHFNDADCSNFSEVVRVTEPVNTVAVVEKQYGDLHTLSDRDLESIHYSMKMLQDAGCLVDEADNSRGSNRCYYD
jgi:hypothetical protein